MIEWSIAIWLSATAVSTVYVAWDAFTRNPELKVMKWGWVLVTLYTGPIGAAVYVLSCQEPAPLEHEEFTAPLWKQSVGSIIHCLAGDATGIVAAAIVTALLGFPMWLDLVAEYVFGFAFGLLVFQALFMRDMVGGSYLAALRATFLPEWLSMNAVMGGMIPVMAVLMSLDATAMEPASIEFWGIMSLATLVGGVIAYPFNVWLVATKLKHGMGTVRVLGHGGRQMEAAPAARGGHGESVGVVTRPQITAVLVLSLVAFAAGIVIAGTGGDLMMSGEHGESSHHERSTRLVGGAWIP